ncbi:shikimate dehydrogenase [Sphingobium sp. SCG-1]|uniref:SDR family NAD(P)-dependent oxidoreductase n=1 Tax=Sphingobium sp. SCG-1 TaxID=2072936 RepID=UPI000CD6B6F5|nr:SDR family NAD(P)-dependent oxidoreductase [Sphingobium sp. SCG-1]AUW57420.1 shikimate dehydrogenase [Sphingobium sp. SCG-1]
MPAFDVTTTTDDVLAGLDLSGKRILVTGVSGGLGLETARALVAHGANVIGTVRDLANGDPVRDAVGKAPGSLDLIALDLASLASVRAAADSLIADGRPLDVVIANAAVMATPSGKTVDGFETQFGTNHLGHFALVNRLAPLLREGARVVILSSAAHRFSDVDLDDPNFETTPYDTWSAYGRSKTANVLFAVEFDRRYKDKGVRAAAVHPGGADTGLKRHMSQSDMDAMVARINSIAKAQTGAPAFKLKTIPQAASTSVWAAIVADADEVGGRFCQDCAVAGLAHAEVIGPGVREYAVDPDNAKALWTKSEELVGERF